MFPEKEILVFHAESSLHAGSGSDIGYVDNPIQRERATGFPILQSNGVKGALREAHEFAVGQKNDPTTVVIFGPDDTSSTPAAGTVSFGEARVLFFPVRSLAGGYACVTCPSALARFQRDLAACGKPPITVPAATIASNQCIIADPACVQVGQQVVLDELAFSVQATLAPTELTIDAALFPATAEYIPFKDTFRSRIVLLNDTDFAYFVTEKTEIEPHNRIDDATGTVANTGVWYTEYLPSETILYTPLFVGTPRDTSVFASASAIKTELVSRFNDRRLWFGGDRTTGKGRVMAHCWSPISTPTEEEE